MQLLKKCEAEDNMHTEIIHITRHCEKRLADRWTIVSMQDFSIEYYKILVFVELLNDEVQKDLVKLVWHLPV